MELETDYPFVWRLVAGDLGVDGRWMSEKLTGKTLAGKVWTCDLPSLAQTTSNEERRIAYTWQGLEVISVYLMDRMSVCHWWKPILTSIGRFPAASTAHTACFRAESC